MSNIKKSIIIFIALLATTYFSPVTFADTMNISDNTSNTFSVLITYTPSGLNRVPINTGGLLGTLDGGPLQNFFSFDIYPSHATVPIGTNITVNPIYPPFVSSVQPSILTGGANPSVQGPYGPHLDNVEAAASLLAFETENSNNFSSFQPLDFAGLQIAIWEMLYNSALLTGNIWDNNGTDFSWTTGNPAFDALLTPIIHTDLVIADTFPGANSYRADAWFLMSNNSNHQVLIGQFLTSVNAPELHTYLLLGSLLVVAMVAARTKKVRL